jgi:L-histidine N-alpha-methyltransferase
VSPAHDPAANPLDAPPADPHDREVMLQDVLEGLARPQKELSPKYFYDTRGSELFEEITYLEEYYPTRTEHALLRRWMPGWVAAERPAALVELGAGSARKSRVLLDAMAEHGTGDLYVPVDVSGAFLHETAARLRQEYDGLRVEPAVRDMTVRLGLDTELPEPAWFALLGSTIGNFRRSEAAALLRRVVGEMRPSDRFLMGADQRPGPHKTREELERAYDDADGVTAAFNLNVLRVLNRELGCDFDESAFRHRAFYREDEDRIEMHLEAREAQVVRIGPDHTVEIEAGETIRTELSCKHDRGSVEELFRDAGLAVERWAQDERGLFALVLGRPRG